MQRSYDGVKFYNAADISCGHSLEKVETVLQTICLENEFADINHILELFNIKQFFNSDLRLKRWTDADFEYYKSVTNKFDRIIASFFLALMMTTFCKG